jgi:hypothetical protein
VNYAAGISKTGFKIVLPFMFVDAVSGDGYSDVTVGASTDGVAHIQYGNNFTTQDTQDVSTMSYSKPVVSYDFSGRSVSNAGDVNGDGYDDLIIGAPCASRCYVLYGRDIGFVNMTEGFTIFGALPSDLTGWSVSGAGDVNNDSFADVVIGAPYAMNADAVVSGASFVIYGGVNLMDVRLDQILSQNVGFVIYGASAQEFAGLSVSSAGEWFCRKIRILYLLTCFYYFR